MLADIEDCKSTKVVELTESEIQYVSSIKGQEIKTLSVYFGHRNRSDQAWCTVTSLVYSVSHTYLASSGEDSCL